MSNIDAEIERAKKIRAEELKGLLSRLSEGHSKDQKIELLKRSCKTTSFSDVLNFNLDRLDQIIHDLKKELYDRENPPPPRQERKFKSVRDVKFRLDDPSSYSF